MVVHHPNSVSHRSLVEFGSIADHDFSAEVACVAYSSISFKRCEAFVVIQTHSQAGQLDNNVSPAAAELSVAPSLSHTFALPGGNLLDAASSE
jgi:hypothetical protein